MYEWPLSPRWAWWALAMMIFAHIHRAVAEPGDESRQLFDRFFVNSVFLGAG